MWMEKDQDPKYGDYIPEPRRPKAITGLLTEPPGGKKGVLPEQGGLVGWVPDVDIDQEDANSDHPEGKADSPFNRTTLIGSAHPSEGWVPEHAERGSRESSIAFDNTPFKTKTHLMSQFELRPQETTNAFRTTKNGDRERIGEMTRYNFVARTGPEKIQAVANVIDNYPNLSYVLRAFEKMLRTGKPVRLFYNGWPVGKRIYMNVVAKSPFGRRIGGVTGILAALALDTQQRFIIMPENLGLSDKPPNLRNSEVAFTIRRNPASRAIPIAHKPPLSLPVPEIARFATCCMMIQNINATIQTGLTFGSAGFDPITNRRRPHHLVLQLGYPGKDVFDHQDHKSSDCAVVVDMAAVLERWGERFEFRVCQET